MISSVRTVPSSLSNVNRAAAQGVRNAVHPTAEPAADAESQLVVDHVNRGEGVELWGAQREGASRPAHEPAPQYLASAVLEDPVQAEMELLAQKTALRANLAVFRTSDRMLGSLLDVVG